MRRSGSPPQTSPSRSITSDTSPYLAPQRISALPQAPRRVRRLRSPGRSMGWRLTGWCHRPAASAPRPASMAKTICSPRSTSDRRWRSSFQPFLPGPAVPGVRSLLPTSCLTPQRIPTGAQRHSLQVHHHPVHLSHAGGFVRYASHLTAVAVLGDTGTSSADAYHNSVFSGTCWRSSIASVVAPLWRVLGGMR